MARRGAPFPLPFGDLMDSRPPSNSSRPPEPPPPDSTRQKEEEVRELLAERDQARLRLQQVLAEKSETEAKQQQLSIAIEHVSEAIVVTDTQPAIVYANPAFEVVTGYSREEALGRNPRFLHGERHDPEFFHTLWETISGGHTWRGHFLNNKKDGTPYTEEAVISPIFNSDSQITQYVAVKRDITEQTQLQQVLQQALKLESIECLAGGVAHEFNNMLQIILGATNIAKIQLDPDSPTHEELNEIQEASLRSVSIVKQLLSFARRQAENEQIIPIDETVHGFHKMLQLFVGEGIELTWTPGAGTGCIRMDPHQLHQMLLNLCSNSRDAISRHGRIDLFTEPVTFDESQPSGHPSLSDGEFICLTVRDNGCGMGPDTLSHIFDPFFTTKETGKGTGLGLSAAYGILHQHGGAIDVNSSPEAGTTCRLYFPLLASGEEAPLPVPIETGSKSGSETVLVVEDEPMVLEQVASSLKSYGYSVLTADTAEAALQIAKQHPTPIHLLLSDITMPRMNGLELSRLLQQQQPGLRSLFMSGYNPEDLTRSGDMEDTHSFLQKPFLSKQLSRAVRKILAPPPPPVTPDSTSSQEPDL
jgi:PAS domain S-box-containing protein